jgi:hypothetical protein
MSLTMPSIKEVFERYTASQETDLFCFNGRIQPWSAREFVDAVLARDRHSKNAAVFMCTYGGDPHSAFRMIRCLKKHYSGGKIRLLIDGPCKSAGALIALGVDEIAFGPRGELGPLDTQLTKQDEIIFMSSGLDILQALSVVTTNAFDTCFANMIELINRSGGAISTKTAADIASSVTAAVFQPITGQIDPLRMGEAQRSMRIAREYGERLSSKLLKQGALDKLVQDYPSHGFVIDKEEALQYFSKVEDLTVDETTIAEFLEEFGEYVRWPKDEPAVFDVSTFFERIRKMEEKRAAEKAKADAAQAARAAATQATQVPEQAPNTGTENVVPITSQTDSNVKEGTNHGDAAKDDGRSSGAQATESTGSGAELAAPVGRDRQQA